MITSEEAKKLIKKTIRPLRVLSVPVQEALGCVLAQSVRATLSLPIMDNSAVDGFVLRSQDTEKATPKSPIHLRIRGTVRAGDDGGRKLNGKEAYRIMTGAPVIRGADTVSPKEEAFVSNQSLVMNRPLPKGRHIRYRGEEVRKGAPLLVKHALIHPGTIAVLTSFGIKKIAIFRKPRVSVIATGSELVALGSRLQSGKIYDSNSWMIAAALQVMRIDVVYKTTVADRPQLIRQALQRALRISDVVIVLGGVSVGDYDYVKAILAEEGVRKVFWQVDQKPGKPLYFGRKKRTVVFGLPGNPASAYVCFYEYVYSALRRMSGFAKPDLDRQHATVLDTVRSSRRKVLFLKAKTNGKANSKTVMPLRHQGSHMVSSLHDANSFIVMPSTRKEAGKGQTVGVDLLPYDGEMMR